MRVVFEIMKDLPAAPVWKMRAHEREAAQVLFDTYGEDELRDRYAVVKRYRGEEYCPDIHSPSDFLSKMPKMEAFLKRKGS